jgi:hypothetical protein
LPLTEIRAMALRKSKLGVLNFICILSTPSGKKGAGGLLAPFEQEETEVLKAAVGTH